MTSGLRLALGVAAAIMLLGSAPDHDANVGYTVLPSIAADGGLNAVDVTISFQGDANGRTIIALPDQFGGVAGHWRYLGDLVAEGANVQIDGQSRRVLTYRPGPPITLHYRVRSAYSADPSAIGGNPYAGAAIRPAWFASLGEFLFAVPLGQENAPATFTWKAWPRGWTEASDLDGALADRPLTVNDLIESTLLAGTDVELRTRAIQNGTLRLATRGSWNQGADAYADRMARIIDRERQFWGHARGPYTVTLFPLATAAGHFSSGGTGRGRGFAQYASANVNEATLLFNIAHEHNHSWIPHRIGEMPEHDEAQLYWLSEGFTDFYAARTLLRTGQWTPAQFGRHLNAKLLAYAVSPARAYSNARIVTDFWTDPAIEQLPYQRGELFALILDRAFHDRGGLAKIVFAMRDRWVAAPVNSKPPLLANLLAVTRDTGIDIRPMLSRFIDTGEPMVMPIDLFGKCASVAQVELASFDPGFDRTASNKTGVIMGVDLAGAAYRAGLRNGMKRLARVSGEEGDSRIPLSYRVSDAGGEHLITWRPEGRGRMSLQEVTLVTPLLPECARMMSGAA